MQCFLVKFCEIICPAFWTNLTKNFHFMILMQVLRTILLLAKSSIPNPPHALRYNHGICFMFTYPYH